MDAAAEWDAARERIGELITGAGRDAATTMVPACPAWSAQDLVAHVIGLDADVLTGGEPEDHNSVWTQQHVDARSGRDVAQLLREWADMAGDMRAYLRDESPRPLNDAIIHEQDLRGALGRPGAKDTPGLATVREGMVGRLADRVDEADLAPIRLVGGDGWTATAGSGDGGPGLTLEGPTFELTRAILSRRSASQLRGWATEGDIERYLACFEVLGPLPESDLHE